MPGTGRSPPDGASSVLHEPDRGVVQIRQPRRPEVRQGTAHRHVAGRLDQRQAETLGPQQLVDLIGTGAGGIGVQCLQRLLDLGVDLRAADLAEVGLP